MKNRFNNLFSKTWVKIIAIITIFFSGLFLLGKCSQVNAANFTLSDGTTSDITYSEGQTLKTQVEEGYVPVYMFIQNQYDFSGNPLYSVSMYNVVNFSSLNYVYNNCTLSDATISCSKSISYSTSFSSSLTINNASLVINIYKDYVTVSGASGTNSNGNYYIVNTGYDTGYQDGLDANQETIYNTGYNTGYDAGKTNGLEEGYNNGYDIGYNLGIGVGKEQGLEEGYNNGYDTGYDAGYDAGYSVGYTEGQNSVDITSDNQTAIDNYITNNKYYSESEYIEYGNTKYTDGTFNGAKLAINKYSNDMLGHISDIYGTSLANAIAVELKELDHIDNYKDTVEYNARTIIFALEDNTGQLAAAKYDEGVNIGYQQGMSDKGGLMALIPSTLGAVVGNAMPILTYEVYGISIMNIIGLIAIVGIAIIAVKFVVGG